MPFNKKDQLVKATFCVKALLILFIICLSLEGLSYGIAVRIRKYEWRRLYNRVEKGTKALVVGTSRVKGTGHDKRLVFWAGGADFNFLQLTVTKYLAKLAYRPHIILELGPVLLMDGPKRPEAEQLLHFHRILEAAPNTKESELASRYQSYWLRNYPAIRAKFDMRPAFFGQLLERHPKFPKVLSDFSSAAEQLAQFSCRGGACQRNVGLALRAVDLILKQGFSLTLLSMPIQKVIRPHLDSASIDWFGRLKSQLASQSGLVTYLDLTFSEQFKDNDFEDPFHLNSSGLEKFNRELAPYI